MFCQESFSRRVLNRTNTVLRAYSAWGCFEGGLSIPNLLPTHWWTSEAAGLHKASRFSCSFRHVNSIPFTSLGPVRRRQSIPSGKNVSIYRFSNIWIHIQLTFPWSRWSLKVQYRPTYFEMTLKVNEIQLFLVSIVLLAGLYRATLIGTFCGCPLACSADTSIIFISILTVTFRQHFSQNYESLNKSNQLLRHRSEMSHYAILLASCYCSPYSRLNIDVVI